MPRTAAVFFDVDFTLIHPGPRFQGSGYAESCARRGISVDPAQFERAVAGASALLESADQLYDAALFVSPSGTTRGRAEVLARYRKRYPDGKALGKLAIDVEELRLTAGGEVSMLGDAVTGDVHGARVVARWTLVRDDAAAPRSGPTLIVFERKGGRWWIVEDASMEFEGP